MRRYPRIGGPAVLPLFCLAPHGVFPASRITPRAVSSYLAFSTLPCFRCGKLTASPTMPKNRRCLFCDTLRRRNFSTATPAYFTRHAAVWCSDFPPANLAIHQRSSAIASNLSHPAKKKSKPGLERRNTDQSKPAATRGAEQASAPALETFIYLEYTPSWFPTNAREKTSFPRAENAPIFQ
jgi:hypothetical protein